MIKKNCENNLSKIILFLFYFNLFKSKAIKEISAGQEWLKQLVEREINTLKTISHENVIKFFEFHKGYKMSFYLAIQKI